MAENDESIEYRGGELYTSSHTTHPISDPCHHLVLPTPGGPTKHKIVGRCFFEENEDDDEGGGTVLGGGAGGEERSKGDGDHGKERDADDDWIGEKRVEPAWTWLNDEDDDDGRDEVSLKTAMYSIIRFLTLSSPVMKII